MSSDISGPFYYLK